MYNELFWHFSDTINETKRKYIMKKMDAQEGEKASIMTHDGPKTDESRRNVNVSILKHDKELTMDTSNMIAVANRRGRALCATCRQ